MYSILDKKRQYLQLATQELEKELSNSIRKTLCAIETNALIADCAAIFDLIDRIDYECNSRPEQLSDEEWETYWDDLESLLAQLLVPARGLIRAGERLAALGENVPALEHLKERALEARECLNWPDYGSTAKYQALADGAEREYLAGETEEGGWYVPISDCGLRNLAPALRSSDR